MRKICLIPKKLSEFDSYYAWYKKRSNQRLILCFFPDDKEETFKIFKHQLEDPKNKEYSVYERKSSRLIGMAQLYLFKPGKARVCILIGDKAFRGKGYGSEILSELIKMAFNELNLKRLRAEVAEYNLASLKLFRKSAFKLVQIKRNSIEYGGNQYDEYIFELMKNR